MSVVPLGGAEKRLLPPAVPVAFFGLALLAHAAAWLIVILHPADVLTVGGPGPGLAAVHALTLGVLVTTAAGAVLQILPVTTQQSAPSSRLAWPVFPLTGGGGAGLVAGFLSYTVPLMIAGAAAAALGLLLFAGVLARLLTAGRAAPLKDTLPALWVALACLIGLAVLAVLLVLDYRLDLLPHHGAAADVHLVLAAYGFMGFLVLGFSHVLVPMLAVAEPPRPGSGRPVLALGGLALTLAAAGLLWRIDAAVWLGAAGGLAASLLHVRLMVGTVRRRMRRRLGPSFVLIRLSWVLLPASVVAGGLSYGGLSPPALFGVLLLPGWLLTLLIGILQRILPFLASMHTVRTCARPASPKTLEWEAPLRVVTCCQPVAVALLAAAVTLDLSAVAVAAGLVGFAGAIAFIVFAAAVALRARRHRSGVGPKAARPSRSSDAFSRYPEPTS